MKFLRLTALILLILMNKLHLLLELLLLHLENGKVSNTKKWDLLSGNFKKLKKKAFLEKN